MINFLFSGGGKFWDLLTAIGRGEASGWDLAIYLACLAFGWIVIGIDEWLGPARTGAGSASTPKSTPTRSAVPDLDSVVSDARTGDSGYDTVFADNYKESEFPTLSEVVGYQ